MAVSVVFSTLMVLAAKQEHDFNTLWSTTGAVNDPTGDKHSQLLQSVILDGNFKSAIVDNWELQEFDSVSVYGMNIFGDALWETEFNITNKSSSLTSWLVSDQIISCTSEIGCSQSVIFNEQNYNLRLSPSSGKSWLALSTHNLSYGPLPLIFVPRSPHIPFEEPIFLDGLLGCWETAILLNYEFIVEDTSSMTAPFCIGHCKTNGNALALLVTASKCFCGDVDQMNPPTDTPASCFRQCTGSTDKCGGFSTSYGNAYHVQGKTLPGELAISLIYTDTLSNVNSGFKISSSNVYASSSKFLFISQVNVTFTGSTNTTYTIHYSELNCSSSTGQMKVVSYDGVTNQLFFGNGNKVDVDMLKVRCIEFVLVEPVTLATIELWGPDDRFDHVNASALVVRGKKYVTDTQSSTTSIPATTSTTVIATSTSTTSPTTITTLSPTTTSTIYQTTTTSTTTHSTTTTSSTIPATTTSTTSPPITTSVPSSNTSVSNSIFNSSTVVPTSTSSTNTITPSSVTTSVSPDTTTSSATTSSATVSTTSTQSSSTLTTLKPKCTCPCNSSIPQLNLTTEKLQERIVEIQRRLAVNVSKLSSTIRKLTSAEDSRTSAVSIGYVGVGILVCILASIVFIDSARLLRDLKKLLFNIRDGICPKTADNTPAS